MQKRALLGRQGPRRLTALLAVGALCVLASVAVSGAEPSADAGTGVEVGNLPNREPAQPATAGRWIYVDPGNGEAGSLPRVGSLNAAISSAPAFSTSHEGLIEVPAPGGGVMVDLQGRFRSAVVARVKPDGGVVTQCTQGGMPVAE